MSGEHQGPDPALEASQDDSYRKLREVARQRDEAISAEGTPKVPVNTESEDEAVMREEVLSEVERQRQELLYRISKEKP